MILRKIFTIIAVALLATVVLTSCIMTVDSEEAGNLVITLPPLSGRAIAITNIPGLRASTKSYRVTVEYSGESQVKSGARETFAFFVPSGVDVKITIDCINIRGTAIVQTKKSIEMREGKHSMSINFAQDGDEVWLPVDLAGKSFVSATGIKMIGITGGTVPLTASYKPKLSSFYMGETEITQAQYKAVLDWAQANSTVKAKYPNIGTSSSNPSYFKDSQTLDAGEIQEKRPVEQVSWFDAVMFCNLLTIKELGAGECVYDISGTGYSSVGNISSATVNLVSGWESKKGYRLPTEAEWEYAARAGNTGDTPEKECGNPDPTGANRAAYAWYKGDPNVNGKTHEVKKKLPNSYNLYDMIGNVGEWCWDCANESTPSAYNTNQTTDPTGWTSSGNRIYRGGAFDLDGSSTANKRLADQPHNAIFTNYKRYGLRVARSQ